MAQNYNQEMSNRIISDLKKGLKARGYRVPLSVVQEEFSKAMKHRSFNVMHAEADKVALAAKAFDKTPLTPFQLACCAGYCGGEWDHAAVFGDVPASGLNGGDGLLHYVLHEVGPQGDCGSEAEAVQRLERMRDDLEKMIGNIHTIGVMPDFFSKKEEDGPDSPERVVITLVSYDNKPVIITYALQKGSVVVLSRECPAGEPVEHTDTATVLMPGGGIVEMYGDLWRDLESAGHEDTAVNLAFDNKLDHDTCRYLGEQVCPHCSADLADPSSVHRMFLNQPTNMIGHGVGAEFVVDVEGAWVGPELKGLAFTDVCTACEEELPRV